MSKKTQRALKTVEDMKSIDVESDAFLNQVRALGEVNQEIISRIKKTVQSKKNVKRITHIVEFHNDNSRFTVRENENLEDTESFLQNWKTKEVTFLIPVDLFGDRIDYVGCTNFSGLAKINESMTIALAKYSFLDPSRAKKEIEKFKYNFEQIQFYLGQIESIFIPNKSCLEEIQSDLDQINSKLEKIFGRVDVGQSLDVWAPSQNNSHLLSTDLKTATQTSTVGTIFSSNGYNSGIHIWKLEVIARPSTCMIGVAPLSVPKNTALYSSHGYFVNWNGGNAYQGGGSQVVSYLTEGVQPKQKVEVILDCTARTVSFSRNKETPITTHKNIDISEKLYLAWNNDSTSGSVLKLVH